MARERTTKATSQLSWSVAALLLLSAVLQVASIFAVLEVEAEKERSRLRGAVAASQRLLVEEYQSATYLAVVGLATSDWEMVLVQRAAAKNVAARFEAMNRALVEGGRAPLGDGEVELARLDDPALRAELDSALALWREVEAGHLRVLRSNNQSLRDNPELDRFRGAATLLTERLSGLAGLIQRHSRERTAGFDRARLGIPAGALLLTLPLSLFVFRRLLRPLDSSLEALRRSDVELRAARGELELRVEKRTAELALANEELRQKEEALQRANEELEDRVRERTQELKEVQHRALDLARQAGMAELATNILHNVGNVLNSINTSATVLGENLRGMRLEPLGKLAALVGEHRADLAGFFARDERGQRLPEYLDKLSGHLVNQRDEMLELTAALHRHVDHVRTIVELQQSYATGATLVEETSLRELIEDAIRINAAALGRHKVVIERELSELPRVMVDKHKVMQIVLNLISNAKYAVEKLEPSARRLTVRMDRPVDDRLRIQVIDNGEGIEPALLTKIFQHGFTTRKTGHGFGLHSCAIAARALGGSLVVHSDGPGRGATFTLEVPYRPAPAPAPAA